MVEWMFSSEVGVAVTELPGPKFNMHSVHLSLYPHSADSSVAPLIGVHMSVSTRVLSPSPYIVVLLLLGKSKD